MKNSWLVGCIRIPVINHYDFLAMISINKEVIQQEILSVSRIFQAIMNDFFLHVVRKTDFDLFPEIAKSDLFSTCTAKVEGEYARLNVMRTLDVPSVGIVFERDRLNMRNTKC